MGRKRPLNEDQWRSLLPFVPAVVGATQAHAEPFPDVLRSSGIQPRGAGRNAYKGFVVTRPESDLIAFGFAYHDRADDAHDEDIYAVDVPSRRITMFRPDEWQKRYPEYGDFHHGDKSFLDPPET